MKRLATFTAVTFLLTAPACITEQQGLLYFSDVTTVPPDTTSEEQVEIAGVVFRTPPRTGLITVVTATGGVLTVVDTANLHMQFSVTVPLLEDAVNYLTLTASDNSGAVAPNPATWTVVQMPAAGASRVSSSQHR